MHWKAMRNKIIDVGWLADLQGRSSGLIWFPPERVELSEYPICNDLLNWNYETDENSLQRYFMIRCPFDMHFKININKGIIGFEDLSDDQAGITFDKLLPYILVSPPMIWRHPRRPLVQIRTPYRFLSDETVYLSQLPVFYDEALRRLPGTLICGRFPIDVWPRPLMWALEWHDLDKPLKLTRGQPWFLVMLETPDMESSFNVFEAELTGELDEYALEIDGVTSCVNSTFSLFKKAWTRRPKKLLKKRVY